MSIYCFDGTSNWNLWGNSVGARDFSPDWKHRYFGTEVPCPDNDKHQFIAQIGVSSNAADFYCLQNFCNTREFHHTCPEV